MAFLSKSTATTLRQLIDELQRVDKDLKKAPDVDGPMLRELRHALDNLRLTAWTVSELQNVRDTRKDTRAMISFLTAERLRRFRRMIDDFSADLEHEGSVWPTNSILDLQTSINLLRERLALLETRPR